MNSLSFMHPYMTFEALRVPLSRCQDDQSISCFVTKVYGHDASTFCATLSQARARPGGGARRNRNE